MISQRNSRFNHLVFMVLLVAPAFMVSTPAQGMFSRAAVRGAGMRRALPSQIKYGFSLVDLIADNPWKSGLVATGVVALIAYFASRKVRRTVKTGFGYIGDGFSWFGHQYKKRVKNYLNDSDAYQELRKAYAQQDLELQPHAADKPETVKDRFDKAEAAFNKAQNELQTFENGNLRYFEQNEPAIKAGTKPMHDVVAQAQANAKEEKEAAAVAAIQKPSEAEVQAEYVRLQTEHARLEQAHSVASRNYLAARDDFEKAKRLFKETGEIMESVAYRNGFSREQLGTFGKSTVALTKLSAEIAEIRKRIDNKTATKADIDKYDELIAKQQKLTKEIEAKQQQLRDHFIHQQGAQDQDPQAPEIAP